MGRRRPWHCRSLCLWSRCRDEGMIDSQPCRSCLNMQCCMNNPCIRNLRMHSSWSLLHCYREIRMGINNSSGMDIGQLPQGLGLVPIATVEYEQCSQRDAIITALFMTEGDVFIQTSCLSMPCVPTCWTSITLCIATVSFSTSPAPGIFPCGQWLWQPLIRIPGQS